MNYNTDGFNNRMVYINNANDAKRIKDNNSIDNSVVQMKLNENKPNVQTVNNDKKIEKVEARGSKENFVLRNHNMMNANKKINPNNPLNNAMNKNMFKKF